MYVDPVYPASAAAEYEASGADHFKVKLTSFEYVEEAQGYIKNNALELGWTLEDEVVSEPLIYVFVKQDDPTHIVWVNFNSEEIPSKT